MTQRPGRGTRPVARSRAFFTTAAVLLCLVGLTTRASSQGLAVDELLRGSTAPDPTTLTEMLARLDALAAEFENQKDVKCWTSFGQLETFVAGADFSPDATHAKTEVVLGFLDQIWRSAASEGTGPVPGARLEAVSERHLPVRDDDLRVVQVAIGDRTLEIPAQDVRDYHGTVEPLRLLRTATERAARVDPERAPLSMSAIEAAQQIAAIYATVVIKESGRHARKQRHERIQTADVMAATGEIALAAGFEPSAPTPPPKAADRVAAAKIDQHAAMREVIKKKIRSLDVFNETYSIEKLGVDFDPSLVPHETQWSARPITEEASQFYKNDTLVELAGLLYRKAAADHPGVDPLGGPEMLETITDLYPSIQEYFGVTLLFPRTDGGATFWVPEHMADAFRDSAWHWKALDLAVARAEAADAALPAMDLYAMEELSEFISIYSVALIRTAGAQARDQGKPQVDVAVIEATLEVFERNRKSELASREKSTRRDAKDWEADAGAARAGLKASFVAEVYSDVTANSGIDFTFEDAKRIHDARFPPAEATRTADGVVMIPGAVSRSSRRGITGPEAPVQELGLAGGGVAVADVDGDGRVDIYLVNGTEDRLYRNLGDLRFEDVTRAAGFTLSEPGRGAYFIDYDNDGDPDLFLTQDWAPNRLYRNRGDGTFEEVTRSAGFPLDEGTDSHSATWFDFDNDGHLDVYVGNFGSWLKGTYPGLHHSRNGQANQLFRNRGDGTFEDITEKTRAGSTGWAHAVSHFDANGDGWQDVFIANDFGADELLINLKGERFFDATPAELRERSLHGMSVGFTDANRDGIDDIYVSNIALFSFVSKYISPGEDTELRLSRRTVENARMVENNVFIVSENGSFVERQRDYFDRSEEGDGWAWDADFLDFDNDGFDDLYVANGREPNLAYDRERNVLYRQSNGRFFDVSRGSGADIASNSRGVVAADLDDDGDLDLVINNYLDRATVLRNNLRRNHWVKIQLQGSRSNRDGVGARLIVHTPSGKQTRTVRGGSGYLSMEPTTQSFGLGEDTRIDRLEVHWPSGVKQTVSNLEAGRIHRVEESAAADPKGIAGLSDSPL